MSDLRFANMLMPSDADAVGLAEAVKNGLKQLIHLYRRTRGTDLMFPKELDADVLRWRTMRGRHERGDLRHSEAELKSTKALAQWSLDVKCDLCGQPRKKLTWKNEILYRGN